MSSVSQHVYLLQVQYEIGRRTGTPFQEFVVQVASLKWGTDFEPRRPQGKYGDGKCDGYLVTEKAVFQAYAPRQMDAEAPPELPALERLYREAGIVLPGISLKRYIEVQQFHEALVRNRRQHLQAELGDAKSRITERAKRLRVASEKRNDALELISSGGALSQYRRWDVERSKLRADFESVDKQLTLAEQIEMMRSDLRVKRAEALRKISQDLLERRDLLEDAVSLFEEISAELYSRPASLDIHADKNGLVFEIDHPDILSLGVRRVQIFTFDLTLALMCARRGAWPGFLIHDSHIFDGVDGRQVAKAMEVAGRRLGELGGQYIVTLNSDDLDKAEVEGNASFQGYVVQPTLDDSLTGCLFGMRFESPDVQEETESDLPENS